jgi:ribosomal protein S18 acetylase RimI-like enzyme
VGPRNLFGGNECRVIVCSEWQLVRDARLAALSESPDAFLGSFNEEFLFQEDDWRKTFMQASWHGSFKKRLFKKRELIGIAKSSILTDYPDERYVESLWVAPKHRVRGIARDIIEHIAAEGQNEGRSFIRLAVLRENSAASKAFTRLGFLPTSGRSNEYENCLELELPTHPSWIGNLVRDHVTTSSGT